MQTDNRYLPFICGLSLLLAAILGCGRTGSRSVPDWTTAKKIAGKEQGLSHISGIVVDDKFAYVTMGGTVADQNAGTSGLRKVDLNSGAVTTLENGQAFPQSETGGIAIDKEFVYWNGGGKILRVAKDGGKPEPIASEHVGIGIDLAMDNEKIYWTNHGYYSPNSPTKPSPVYAVSKKGGEVEIFADQQNIPHSVVVDETSVYWVTPTSIVKQAKSGGTLQVIYQASDKEGIDELAQDADHLYFGFRGAGKSRWSLRKVSKQGGEPETLVQTYSVKPIVVDESNVYFFDEDGITKDVLCRVSKSGGAVTKLDTGYASGVIAVSSNQVYVATLDDIFCFTK